MQYERPNRFEAAGSIEANVLIVDLSKDTDSAVYAWAIDLPSLGIPFHVRARPCWGEGCERRQHRVCTPRTGKLQAIQAFPGRYGDRFLLWAGCHLHHRLCIGNDLKHRCWTAPDIPKEDRWIYAGRTHSVCVQHVESGDGFQARMGKLPYWGRGLCLQVPKTDGSITGTCAICSIRKWQRSREPISSVVLVQSSEATFSERLLKKETLLTCK